MEAITQEEFNNLAPAPRDGKPLGNATARLKIGQGFKTPCTWNHTGRTCNGAAVCHMRAKRTGFHVRTRCIDKILYIFREA